MRVDWPLPLLLLHLSLSDDRHGDGKDERKKIAAAGMMRSLGRRRQRNGGVRTKSKGSTRTCHSTAKTNDEVLVMMEFCSILTVFGGGENFLLPLLRFPPPRNRYSNKARVDKNVVVAAISVGSTCHENRILRTFIKIPCSTHSAKEQVAIFTD